MLKFSQLNGHYEIPEKEGSSYIWKLPTGRAMLIVAPVEMRPGACISFGHPNLVARIGKAFEYKHTRDDGSKRWTAAPGFEYWFLIPLDKIELIPEPGYSYVKVNIAGVPFTLNVSGGTSGRNWEDWVGDTAHLCGTRGFNTKLLNHLANAALPPSEIGNLEVHRPDDRARFAGQALEGIAKNWSMPCNPCKAMDDAARTAYYLADAMLKACEVPNES
jgi:hypothetical protein